MPDYSVTDERLAKLPRWARMEIERLRRNEAFFLAKLNAGPEDSDTFADPYSASRRPLGRGPSIQFLVTDEQGGATSIMVRTEQQHDGTVVLDVSGGSGIVVYPRASNSIEIGGRAR